VLKFRKFVQVVYYEINFTPLNAVIA